MSKSSDQKNGARQKQLSPELLKNLPPKQRVPLQYGPKLEQLRRSYPSICLKFEEGGIVTDLTDVLAKMEFTPLPQPDQKPRVLVHNLIKWLGRGNLVLLHFRPKFTDFNIIHLLREVKLAAPACRFEGLVPVFFGSVSSQKQMELFKHLGAFGIRYAFFLTPGGAPDKTLEEIMEELVKFNTLLTAQESTGKISALDIGEALEDDPAKVKRYKDLVSKGEAALASGSFEEAIAHFSQAIELGPNFDALMERGEAYYKARQYIPALGDFREAAKLAKTAPQPYARIGECCMELVRETAAKGDIAKAKSWFETGMGNLEEAAERIQKMEEENRDKPEQLPAIPFGPILTALAAADIRGIGLAEEEARMERFAHMVLDRLQGQKEMVSDVSIDTRIDEALLLARYGKYQEAETIFRDVVKENPEAAGPAFNNFAVELRKNGQHGMAFHSYCELLRHEIPDRDIVLENMKNAGLSYAAALAAAGETEKVVDTYRTIISLRPKGREWVLCELAIFFLGQQDQSQAAFTLMEAFYVNPKLMESPRFEAYRDLASLRNEMMKKLGESEPGKEIR